MLLRDTFGQHQFKAEQNERFSRTLDHSDLTQGAWAFVAAFYSALHYVQACLVKAHGNALQCSSHTDRARLMRQDAKLRALYPRFDHLYELSRRVRYTCNHGLNQNAFDKEALPALNYIKTETMHMLGSGIQAKPSIKLPPEPPKPFPGKP